MLRQACAGAQLCPARWRYQPIHPIPRNVHGRVHRQPALSIPFGPADSTARLSAVQSGWIQPYISFSEKTPLWHMFRFAARGWISAGATQNLPS